MPAARSQGSPARRLAHDVLIRVERDGAFSSRSLDAAIGRSTLEPADRGFATELVYGTLRMQRRIDFLLDQYARKPVAKLPAHVRVALRLAAYQLTATRVPSHAAINEAVGSIGRSLRHFKGLTNAVLRKLAGAQERDSLPVVATLVADPCEALAIDGSLPTWLVVRLVAMLGLEAAREWVATNNLPPPVSLRVNRGRCTLDQLTGDLQAAGINAKPIAPCPDALLVSQAGSVKRMPGFEAGWFVVQDPAAQLVSYLVDPQPGELVLDACAAPGGKSCHLADLMQGKGTVLAVDLHPAKTRLIQANATRLGAREVVIAAADASKPAALRSLLEKQGVEWVDAVLLDAPCSGLGTLRRRPELRLQPESRIAELVELQDALLDSTASLIRPGGRLVYSVCTFTEEETDQRVRAFLERHADFVLESPGEQPCFEPFVQSFGSEGRVLRTWTHLHDMDSFFAARFRRNTKATAS